MPNKKYTHLFFDLDNTLWDFNKNSRAAMLAAFSILLNIESQPNFDDFYETYSYFNRILWDDYRNQLLSKKELTRIRFQKTFEKSGIINIDADEMNSVYLNEMTKQLHLVEGALDVLEYLKSKGYQLNIISNGFSEVQYKKLENTGLSEYFNKIFLSGEVKTPKPGLKIFEYAVKSTNARKAFSLMIGDDWEVDICGARNFGIDAVYFSRGQNGNDIFDNTDKKTSQVYIIDNLTQLLSIL
jgi:putative hydrolase of the HAD superfamily